MCRFVRWSESCCISTAYDAAYKLELDGDNKAVLIAGAEEWPHPIPLIRERGRWHFDIKAGPRG